MTDSTGTLPVPGWYDDPSNVVPGQRRWWTGEAWSDYVEAPPEPGAVASLSSLVPEVPDFTARAAAPVAPPAVAEASPLASAGSIGGYEPMSRGRAEAITFRDIPSRWGTASVWLIALSPILQAVAVVLIVLATWASGFNLGVLIAALAVPPLLMIAWAYRDRARLDSFGYDAPAHWAWILLSPLAYLIARTIAVRKVARIGSAPLWTYAGINVVLIAVSFVIPLLVPSLLAGDLSKSAEDALEADLLSYYGTTHVATCPATDVTFGTSATLTCEVLNDQGLVASVPLAINADGTFSYALPEFQVPEAPTEGE